MSAPFFTRDHLPLWFIAGLDLGTASATRGSGSRTRKVVDRKRAQSSASNGCSAARKEESVYVGYSFVQGPKVIEFGTELPTSEKFVSVHEIGMCCTERVSLPSEPSIELGPWTMQRP